MSDELCMNCGFPIVAGEWRAMLKDGQSVHLSNTNCMLRLVAHRDKMVEMRDAAISQRDVAEVRMARAEAELDIERDRAVAAENELQRVYEQVRRVEAERDELRAALREAEGIETEGGELLPDYGEQVQIVISAQRLVGGGWRPSAMHDHLYPLTIPHYVVHFWRRVSRERIELAFSDKGECGDE